MLNPNARSLYTTALTPPPGMVFDEAIGTTFSLDPNTLLTIPVHLALLASRDGDPLRDGIAVLESMRRLSDRITVYAQSGRLQVPGQPHPLYGLLEKMIVEVTPTRDGVFHPKLWLLKFTDLTKEEKPLLRLMVLSRNLTTDRSWDLCLLLEGRIKKQTRARRKQIFEQNKELEELIAKLPSLAVAPLEASRKEQAARLAKEARRADWELPPGYDQIHFRTLGLHKKKWVPETSSTIAVISPFCTDVALDRIAESSSEPIALITNPETLLELDPGTRELFSRHLVLDDAAETEDGEDSESSAQRDILGLHAKAYIFERGWNTHLVMGSANATNAALVSSLNIEVLVELIGKRSRVGSVESLLNAEGLGEVLMEFTPPEEVQPTDEARLQAEKALETACKKLCTAEFQIICTNDTEEGKWSLSLIGKIPDLVGVKNTKVWPITVTADYAKNLVQTNPDSGVLLGSFSPTSITGLIAFELSSEHPEVNSRFALNLPITGLPEHRDAEILKMVIRNQDGFLRYLLLLLGDMDEGSIPPDDSNGDGGDWRCKGYLTDLPLLEELTRAFSREPERLKDIGRVIKRLTKETEGAEEMIPADFLELWNEFEQALRRTS